MSRRREKWDRWFTAIYNDVTDVVVYRHVFWEVQEIIKRNPRIQKPSVFYQFIGSSYATLGVMAVRRQVKDSGQSISFARMLREMSENYRDISRKAFVGLYSGTTLPVEWANKDFDHFAGPEGKFLDPSIPANDLKELKRRAVHCETFSDRVIAHLDKRKPKTIPKYQDVDSAVDFLCELLIKYRMLLRAESLDEVMPTLQYDWKQVFYEPWIADTAEAEADED